VRVAVVGATGRVGSRVATRLRAAGHEPVAISRAAGVDVVTGQGLEDALTGVEAVVDAINSTAVGRDEVESFFTDETTRLLDAEVRAGVGHHVLLSIVGIDRVPDNAHYAGKRAQERLVEQGAVPWSIQRATQFFDFPATVASWTTHDGAATVPPLLMQPVAVDDVADVLVEIATGPPRGRAPDLAGPETQAFVDMVRRTFAVRGDTTRLVPGWRGTPFSTSMAGEVLLPDEIARIAPTTFEAWLAAGAP